MIICEKITNIEKICYSNYGDIPFPFVKFKTILDYFISNNSIVITIDNDKIFETCKIFQYNFNKMNSSSLSYSIYEFLNGRRKEYIIRIVEWDKVKAKEKISNMSNEVELELNSEIYYINSILSPKIRLLLKKIRNCFNTEIIFKRGDTVNLESEVYIDYAGFSKTIQWGAPYISEKIEDFLDETILKVKEIIHELNDETILRADVLFDLEPYEYEKILMKNKN